MSSEIPDMSPLRRWLPTIARVVAALALLAVLSFVVDLRSVGHSLAAADPAWVIVGIALGFCQHVINSGKWWLLIRSRGLHLPYLRLLGLNFISIMYGTVLPGQLAGEAVKIHRLSRESKGRTILVATVLLDRITGLVGLIILGAIGLLLSAAQNGAAWTVFAVGTGGIVGVCALMWLLAHSSVDERSGALHRRLAGAVLRVMAAAASFRQQPRALANAMGLSIAFQGIGVVSVWCFAEAIHVDISVAALAWVFAVVSVLQMLPITFAGIGPRDGALVYLLAGYGVSSNQALAISLLLLAGILSIALAGFVVEFASRSSRAVAAPVTSGNS